MDYKVYVDVDVSFDTEGNMRPRIITWEDGTKFEVDRIFDVRPAPAQKAGGQGDRFTISVMGRRTYLFFERCAEICGVRLGRWFVERREA